MEYKIEVVRVKEHDTSYGGYRWKLECVVNVNAKDWNRAKKDKTLGHFYNTEIGNKLNKFYGFNRYGVPSVSDSGRAKNGVKQVVISHYFRSNDLAERLGIKLKKLKNGHAICEEFMPCVQVRPRLILVVDNTKED